VSARRSLAAELEQSRRAVEVAEVMRRATKNNLSNLTSSRPTPLLPKERRGRIVSSLDAKRRLASARRPSEFLKAENGCSLYLGERVRVRADENLTFLFSPITP
jgi:hypothetical protein